MEWWLLHGTYGTYGTYGTNDYGTMEQWNGCCCMGPMGPMGPMIMGQWDYGTAPRTTHHALRTTHHALRTAPPAPPALSAQI
jgi:hypothetical protein